jgi:glutamine cyclotransferase
MPVNKAHGSFEDMLRAAEPRLRPLFWRYDIARMRASIHIFVLVTINVVLVPLTGCDKNSSPSASNNVPAVQSRSSRQESSNAANAATAEIPIYTYDVINTYPHDPGAFTQGLVFLDGALLESTGLYGQSTLRKVDLKTGGVLKRVEVPAQYFAEGLAVLDGQLFQLTWQNHKGFVYDLESFQLKKDFSYEGEGWGLATDGHWLILSDGTDQIRFLDPATFEVKRTIHVTARGQPVNRLNELEYVNGEIFANVWGSDYVVRIDPATGRITGVIDFTGLLAPQDRSVDTDVLNGIAYDAGKNRLFITGKKWPKMFEVRLKLK